MRSTSIILALSAALAVLPSCDKMSPGRDGLSVRPAVSVPTKGVITGTTFPTSRPMVVSADLSTSTGGSGGYFSAVPFTYDAGGAVWKPTGEYYWPMAGTLEFLAYSQGSVSVTPTWTRATKVVLVSSDFTQDDVLVGGLTGATSSSKTIVFKHALSQVRLSGKASAANVVKIKAVSFSYSKGATLTVTKSAGSSAVTVSTSALTAAASAQCFSGNKTLSASFTDIGSPLLLPAQSLSEVKIVYTLTNNGTESAQHTVTKSLSTALSEGKAYDIKLDFTLTGISIAVSMIDWTDVSRDVTTN